MKYQLLSDFSDKELILKQDQYLKLRQFFLNPDLCPDPEFKKCLPEAEIDWIPELKIKFRSLVQVKLPNFILEMEPTYWNIAVIDSTNNSVKLAYWNYLGCDYLIQESRVKLSHNIEYWSAYQSI